MNNHDHLEEKFFGKKESKSERKIASRKDRSKYKKTDLDQKKKLLKEDVKEGLARGKVTMLQGEEIVVDCEGRPFFCVLKGRLKKERLRVKNLVVVGDFVWFEKTGGIVEVEERTSLLSRIATHEKRKEQIIASNIDCVWITVSVAHPPLKSMVIDRFIIAAHKGNMEACLVVNKMDLLEDRNEVEALVGLYRGLGLTVCCVSAEKGWGIEELQQKMQGKASLFAGESGVGKSSLINAVTGEELKTRLVAHKTKKGVHTTSSVTLIPLPCGGWCIDSPGIQSFGVWDLERADLLHYFSEIFEIAKECKFPDCTHNHEPHCKVKEAAQAGTLSLSRYDSFRKLWEELEK